MKRRLLTLALMTACAVGTALPVAAAFAAEPATQATIAASPDPARQLLEVGRLFRANDLTGLAEALVPPSEWQQIKLAYELQRLAPADEHTRAKVGEMLQRVTADDAVDQLMLEIEPKLDEARPQLPGATLMGLGAMQMAISSPESDLTEEQRASLAAALPGLQRWIGDTDVLSPSLMRDALTLLTDAARRTGISNVDELKALTLDDVLDRAGIVFSAAKDAVRLYGIDLDEIAGSLQVDVIAIEGATARVRTTVTVFDAPVSAEHELVLVDGRWYGKHAVIHFEADDLEHEQAAQVSDVEG